MLGCRQAIVDRCLIRSPDSRDDSRGGAVSFGTARPRTAAALRGGPGPLSIVPNELGFWRSALEFLPRLHREYGDLVRLRLVGRTVVAAFAPEHVRQVTK